MGAGLTLRIRKLAIQNFGAFDSLELSLDESATVLVGKNASGKSVILEALAVALGGFLSGFSDGKYDLSIPRRFVRTDDSTGQAQLPCTVFAEFDLGDQHIESRREVLTVGGRTINRGALRLRGLARQLESRLGGEPRDLLPVIAYYRSGRLWLRRRRRGNLQSVEGAQLIRRRWAQPLLGYEGALTAAVDPSGFSEWLSRLALMHRRAYGDGLVSNHPEFVDSKVVDVVVCGCLEGAVGMRYDVNLKELLVSFRDGRRVSFDRLSDGQRNLVALAGDIAWRIMQLNSHLGVSALQRTPGVILIDEVDLHLHPAWQWRVLPNLQGVFPSVQFVVTTHAGPVVSSAPIGALRLLDGSRVIATTASGKDINSILIGLMSTRARPEEVQVKLDELALCVESGENEVAESLILSLAGVLGEDDPTVVAARWEMQFASRLAHEED